MWKWFAAGVLLVSCHHRAPEPPKTVATRNIPPPQTTAPKETDEQHHAAVQSILDANAKRQLDSRETARTAVEQRDAEAAKYRADLEAGWAAARVDGIAKLGAEGREKKLRACYAGTQNCSQLALDIYAVTTGIERLKLAALSERLLIERVAQWKDPPTDPLFCCDGSKSENCVVGSKLPTCCRENGGSCGYGIREP